VDGAPFQRALVIRGGALGDFLLTLPVLQTLREATPGSQLHLLAYPGAAALAEVSGMADHVRSIEYGPLAGFFTRGTVLDPALRDYFGSFDLVVSYLYDPDGFFADNLRDAGVRRLIKGPHRPGEKAHAIDQLAAPLVELGLPLTHRAASLAMKPKAERAKPILAIHPGSGSVARARGTVASGKRHADRDHGWRGRCRGLKRLAQLGATPARRVLGKSPFAGIGRTPGSVPTLSRS
jgi:heptosyltransferase-3